MEKDIIVGIIYGIVCTLIIFGGAFIFGYLLPRYGEEVWHSLFATMKHKIKLICSESKLTEEEVGGSLAVCQSKRFDNRQFGFFYIPCIGIGYVCDTVDFNNPLKFVVYDTLYGWHIKSKQLKDSYKRRIEIVYKEMNEKRKKDLKTRKEYKNISKNEAILMENQGMFVMARDEKGNKLWYS